MDPHVHTCLSPCAELDMHPAALARAARETGIDMVAVCDHNSAENAAAVARAGRAAGLAVIPGMEITSAEEAHILALMPDLDAALSLQSKVYSNLPGRNDERVFGLQVIANENAEVLGFNEHLLAGATTLDVDEVVDAIHKHNGLAVASHVDRERFGIVGQLGFIPPGLALDAVEISTLATLPLARTRYAPKGEFPILCSSDAHEPKDLGRARTFLLLEEPSFSEVRRALHDDGGRAILGGGRPMEDLALHILDIAHNSLEAGATAVEIELAEDPASDRLVIEVRDNGTGMEPEILAHVTDPFFTTRTTRKVGMGLSLLAEAARNAGGSFTADSNPGLGTRIRAAFQHSHIDRAPVGDIETTVMVLIAGHPEVDFSFLHRIGDRSFELHTHDLRAALEGVSLVSPQGLRTVRAAIRQGETALSAE